MKRTNAAIFFGLMLLLGSCSLYEPLEFDPVFTPVSPTLTPDTCSAAYLSNEMDIIRAGMREFQEVAFIANSSPPKDLTSPILRLEDIRTRIMNISTPACLASFKQAFRDYSGTVIRYLTARMDDPDSNDYKIEQQNSETLWKALEREYEKAILTIELEFIPLTGLDSAFSESGSNLIMAVNDGSKSVNIRSEAGLDSSVIGRLEPGMQAVVLGKNVSEDWVRINYLGVFGWVYIDTVALTGDLDEIDLIETF